MSKYSNDILALVITAIYSLTVVACVSASQAEEPDISLPFEGYDITTVYTEPNQPVTIPVEPNEPAPVRARYVLGAIVTDELCLLSYDIQRVYDEGPALEGRKVCVEVYESCRDPSYIMHLTVDVGCGDKFISRHCWCAEQEKP